MQGIDLTILPGKAHNQIVICVNYLGRKVTYLPEFASDIWEKHRAWVIVAIIVAVVLICFWEVGIVICGTVAGFKLGEYVSPWIGHRIEQWCLEALEYQNWLVVVAIVALSLAAEYLIATAVINGTIGFIKGVGGEQRLGQGGQPGENNNYRHPNVFEDI